MAKDHSWESIVGKMRGIITRALDADEVEVPLVAAVGDATVTAKPASPAPAAKPGARPAMATAGGAAARRALSPRDLAGEELSA
jgi:hypothetical protein